MQCLKAKDRNQILDSFNEALTSLQGFGADKHTIRFVEIGEITAQKVHICRKLKRRK